MPSSYTLSLRLTLQATGENNNTWGAILNSGVFGLVDYAVAGVLSFALSGSKSLTTALGATDEARAAFLQVVGGSGGTITIPPVSKGYFVVNATSGPVTLTAGGGTTAIFQPGDAGPMFSDGGSANGLQLSNKPIGQYIRDGDQAVIDYVNLAISQGNALLPPVTVADSGKALMVRLLGGTYGWTASAIQQADVVGLLAAFSTRDAAIAANYVQTRAFYGDLF